MTPEEFRMPETKKPFREYLEGLPPDTLINPGDIFGCFFCGFVRTQLGWPDGKSSAIQFHWDTYSVGHKLKVRALPEWAKQFTFQATERAVCTAFKSRSPGKLTPATALEVLRKC